MLSLRNGHYVTLLMTIGRVHGLLSGAVAESQSLHLSLIPDSQNGEHSFLQILQLALVVLSLAEQPQCGVIYPPPGICCSASLSPALGRTLPTVSFRKWRAASSQVEHLVDFWPSRGAVSSLHLGFGGSSFCTCPWDLLASSVQRGEDSSFSSMTSDKGRASFQPRDVSKNLNQEAKEKPDNTRAWRSLIIHKSSWVQREGFSGGSPGKNVLSIKLHCS